MSTKHTPGPWYLSKRNPLRVIASGPRRQTLLTASTRGLGPTAADAQAEAEANARLAQAAPDLLKALEALREKCKAEGWLLRGDTVAEMDESGAAIAKATGQS